MARTLQKQPIAKLLFHLLVLRLLLSATTTQAQSTKQCISEFALANQACAFVTDEYLKQKDLSEHGHGHGRRHGHRRGGSGGGRGDRDEQDSVGSCCDWLKRIDKKCVCEALMLRLPKSLTKPKHSIKVSAGRSCKVTFKCQGVDL